jgi:hypothetical protein
MSLIGESDRSKGRVGTVASYINYQYTRRVAGRRAAWVLTLPKSKTGARVII